MIRLFGEESSCESLLAVGRDEDTAFAVLRERATMDSDAGAGWYLFQDREQSLELG